MTTTITIITINIIRALSDGLGLGLYWLIAVIVGKGAPVSYKATSTHAESMRLTMPTLAATIILRSTAMLAQVSPLS